MGIRKAVFPAAGLGTRFLPATKAQPKEMLPLVDKPCIQYVVEEAVESGVEQVTIVTGRGKRAIEDHFDMAFELEQVLRTRNKEDLLSQIDGIHGLTEKVTFCYIRQKEALGLGHAIYITRDLIGKEPFAVLLGDDIIYSQVPALKQLIDAYDRLKCSILAIQEVPESEVHHYGVIAGRQIDERLYQVTDLVEKPKKEDAPSNLAIIGRYILTPEIFDSIEATGKDARGEIQITDALRHLLKRQAIYAYKFDGIRYDSGTKIGFLKASVELALRRKDLGAEFQSYLKSLDINSFQQTD